MTGTEEALHPIPVFPFPEQAVRAFGRVAAYGRWRNATEGAIVVPPGMDTTAAAAMADRLTDEHLPGRWLEPDEVDAFLACAGIRCGADDQHGVDGVEVVVGVVDDPSFGPLLRFGLGGVEAELFGDRAHRILPLTDKDAAELLRAVRLSPLLFGGGGHDAIDEAALVELLLRVSALAEAVPQLAELQLDPILARPDGVSVAGARVRVAAPPTGPGPLLRRLH